MLRLSGLFQEGLIFGPGCTPCLGSLSHNLTLLKYTYHLSGMNLSLNLRPSLRIWHLKQFHPLELDM